MCPHQSILDSLCTDATQKPTWHRISNCDPFHSLLHHLQSQNQKSICCGFAHEDATNSKRHPGSSLIDYCTLIMIQQISPKPLTLLPRCEYYRYIGRYPLSFLLLRIAAQSKSRGAWRVPDTSDPANPSKCDTSHLSIVNNFQKDLSNSSDQKFIHVTL